jgi:hypothetical protein
VQVRATVVTAIGLLLALAATLGPLPSPAGEPGASLAIRLPDAVRTVVVVLLALSTLLLLLAQRPRRPGEDEPLPTRALQRRPAWAAVLVPLPFLLVATAAWYFTRKPWSAEDGDPLQRAFTTIADLLDLLTRARKAPVSMPAFDLTIAALVLVFALAIFALMLLLALAGPLEKWLAGREGAEPAPAVTEDEPDRLEDLRAEPDARTAIIRAYGRFEHAVAAAHVPRAPWQTPTEFMRTAFARLPVPVPPLQRLTALFELARFSNRPLGSEARNTACDSLEAITTALKAETEMKAETEPPPSETAHPRLTPGKRSDTADAR